MTYDVIIIGGGPAGISAGIYAASRGMKTLILEKSQVGGTIRTVSNVTHYSGVAENETGKTFSERLKNQALGAGVMIKQEEVTSVNLDGVTKDVKTHLANYHAKALIIANGTTPRHLGIPGEEKLFENGVDYHLSDQTEIYRDKDIYIVGGSDGALKEALFLSKLAKQVTLIHFEDKLGAIAEFTKKAENTDNLTILLHSKLTKIEGDNQIEALEITDINSEQINRIQAPNSYVFIYAGSTPNTDLYPTLSTDNGYITVNGLMQTNKKGVYAAGDICQKQVRQIATAVSDGAIAGIQAAAYVHKNS